MKIKARCLNCGAEFEVHECHIKRGSGKYCSYKCRGEFRTKNQTTIKTCPVCGNKFKCSNSRHQTVCSTDCKKAYYCGEKNPNWKGIYPRVKECVVCKKIFYVNTSSEFLNQKTCSRKCSYVLSGRSQLNRIKIKCAICGKIFEVSFVHGQSRRTCSLKCMAQYYRERSRGQDNPNWKNAEIQEDRRIRNHPMYRNWRDGVLARDKYTCQSCFCTDGEMHVHHIIPFSSEPRLRLKKSNGITLCKTCHFKFHSTIKEINILESNLRDRCKEYFKSEPEVVMFKIHGHESQETAIPDYIGCVCGFFVAIELKIIPNFATPLQQYQIRRIKSSQGFAFVCYSLDNVKEVINLVKSSAGLILGDKIEEVKNGI